MALHLSEGLGHAPRCSVRMARRKTGADARRCARAMCMRRAPTMWVGSVKRVGKLPAAPERLRAADWILISQS